MLQVFVGLSFVIGLTLAIVGIGTAPTPAAPVSTPKLMTANEVMATLDWLATVAANEQELTDESEHFADMMHSLTVPSFTETFDIDYMFLQPLPMPAPVVTAEETFALDYVADVVEPVEFVSDWLDDCVVTVLMDADWTELPEAEPVATASEVAGATTARGCASAKPLTVVAMRKWLTRVGVRGAARFNKQQCLTAMLEQGVSPIH